MIRCKKGLTPKTNPPFSRGEIPEDITEVVGQTPSDPTTLNKSDISTKWEKLPVAKTGK